ncbi:MAG TPA: hypothetical protein VN857_16280, partial [Chthoniobacterales bacterium]|nr:hypothetical protein [Chthoniobacterales bacterium]
GIAVDHLSQVVCPGGLEAPAGAGTEVHPTRARRVAKKREVQFGRPGSSTQLDGGKYVMDPAKTCDVYIATI